MAGTTSMPRGVRADAPERSRTKLGLMSGASAAIVGAAIGAVATIAGSFAQSVFQTRREEQQRRETREAEDRERRQEVAYRYLFQLQDAVDSLRYRLDNWATRGGQTWAASVDAEYWDVTTLYALARALAAERILMLEGVYPQVERRSPGLGRFLIDSSVEGALGKSLRGLFYYHRLALAESALQREVDGFRIATYSEFRQRYADPGSGLDKLLAPAVDAIERLDETGMIALKGSLDQITEKLGRETGMPSGTP
jgi:hypothetical protein